MCHYGYWKTQFLTAATPEIAVHGNCPRFSRHARCRAGGRHPNNEYFHANGELNARPRSLYRVTHHEPRVA